MSVSFELRPEEDVFPAVGLHPPPPLLPIEEELPLIIINLLFSLVPGLE